MKFLKLFEEFVDYQELEVKKSNIEGAGNGLFTLVDIDKGHLIAEFTGKIISEEEAQKLEGERGHYLVAKKNGEILDVYGSESPAIYANDAHMTHYENNSEIQELEDGSVWLVATDNIHAGQEIMCEYGDDYWDNWSN